MKITVVMCWDNKTCEREEQEKKKNNNNNNNSGKKLVKCRPSKLIQSEEKIFLNSCDILRVVDERLHSQSIIYLFLV